MCNYVINECYLSCRYLSQTVECFTTLKQGVAFSVLFTPTFDQTNCTPYDNKCTCMFHVVLRVCMSMFGIL